MRILPLRKLVVGRAIVSLGSIILSVSLLGVVHWMVSGREEELAGATGKLRQVQAEIQSSEQMLTQSAKSLESYSHMQQAKSGSGGVDRARLAELLDQLKEDYALTDLSLRLSPVTLLADPKLVKPTVEMEHTLVSLTFGGMSDVLLLSFVEDLVKQIPGYIQPDSFALDRKSGITSAYVHSLAQEKPPAAVTGYFNFHWIAPKTKAASPSASGGGNAPAATP